jgi:Zn finger protein HypA/HybF involved in hydrogenase expression
MHEMGSAPGRLDRVCLAVGELAAVEPELIAFAWEAVTSGTRDADSRLEIRWCPARQACAACGGIDERVEAGWLRLCPHCSAPLRVEGGDELDIERIEFTTDDDEGGR